MSAPIYIDLNLCDSVPTGDYDRDPLAFWQANYERRADEDFAADHSGRRRAWEGTWS
jgi:hypothetical protein